MQVFGKRFLAGCCLLAAGVQPGLADTPQPAAPAEIRPAIFDWQGPYGGLLFSVKSFRAGIPGLSRQDKVKGSGRLAGIVAGYNLTHQRLVYGIEADLGYGQMRALNANGRYKADLTGTVRARLGRSFDNNLVYGTAGIAIAGVNQTSAMMLRGDTSAQIGWIIGGGLEHAFARSLTGRIEYLYGRNIDGNAAGLRDMHMIRAGAVYHLPD